MPDRGRGAGRRSTTGCSARCPATCRRSARWRRSSSRSSRATPAARCRPTRRWSPCSTRTPASRVAIMDGDRDHGAAHGRRLRALDAAARARPDARVLAIVGTGVQARAHARAVPLVREFGELRVAGRDAGEGGAARRRAARRRACRRTRGRLARGRRPRRRRRLRDHARARAGRARARGSRRAPTSRRSATTRTGRELDDATVADALVVVESRATALAPAAGRRQRPTQPIRDGLISAGHVHAEIGELVAGTRPGRTSDRADHALQVRRRRRAGQRRRGAGARPRAPPGDRPAGRDLTGGLPHPRLAPAATALTGWPAVRGEALGAILLQCPTPCAASAATSSSLAPRTVPTSSASTLHPRSTTTGPGSRHGPENSPARPPSEVAPESS